MLDFIQENISVWETLKTTVKPIILYGMGNGADKIINWCEANNVKVAGIFATDEFVRYQEFRGLIVSKYSDIIAQFGEDILIVIAFASERPEVLARFKELAAKHETLAPHLPLFEEMDLVSDEWLQQYGNQLEQVYNMLADEPSRKAFASILNYKYSGKISYLFDCETKRTDDLQELFTWNEGESYLDLGAYNGDTVQEFLQLAPNPKRIIAVEPDRRNFRKLKAFAEALEAEQGIKCECHECGVWQVAGELSFSDSGGRQSSFCSIAKKLVPVADIDMLANGRAISYIKMDVEGVEKQALAGGKKVIQENKPKLFVAAYHYDNDLWEIPLLIKKLVPEYKLYLRKHPYVPCWEINCLVTI